MPRKAFIQVKLSREQPDCCAVCPLLGIIPKNEVPFGSKETYVCIARQEAMSQRGTKVKKSERDSHHPLRRPCDNYWNEWVKLGTYPMKNEFYLKYRLPFDANQQMVIKFHGNNATNRMARNRKEESEDDDNANS